MQQEKHQHPTWNLETGGQVLISPLPPPKHQPSAQKISVIYGCSLLFLGLLGGWFVGNFAADRKVAETENALKLEQLQRAATRRQIEKFCNDSLGGNYGK